MALEIKPMPELSGQALDDFLDKVENFKDDTPPERVREIMRWGREIVAKQRKKLEDAESKNRL
jgi:hypothetical protein